jgi:hypothetical protein
MNYQSRPKHQQRQDKRFLRSGLVVEVNRQPYPVVNFSIGGMLIGNASTGFLVGQKIFLTLFQEQKPTDKTFLYGYVVRVDIFERIVGVDFVKPSDDAFQYLEKLRSPFRTGGKPIAKAKSAGLFAKLFKK